MVVYFQRDVAYFDFFHLLRVLSPLIQYILISREKENMDSFYNDSDVISAQTSLLIYYIVAIRKNSRYEFYEFFRHTNVFYAIMSMQIPYLVVVLNFTRLNVVRRYNHVLIYRVRFRSL